MNTNMNITIKNNFFNVGSVNQGLFENNFAIKGNVQQGRKDTISISPSGRAKSLIESLNKQKEKIIESKNELIARTLEKGCGMDSIKDRLETFEEQIKGIDNQIAQITSEQLKQQAEEQKKIAYKKPKTEDGAETERLHSMVSMSSSLDEAKVVSSVKTKVEGQSKVLRMEIKLDASRKGVHKTKYENLAKLQNRSSDLIAHVGESLSKVYEEIKEIKENDENRLVESEYSKTAKKDEPDKITEDKKERNIADKITEDKKKRDIADKTEDKNNNSDSHVKKFKGKK
jgi:cellobiose-specific phosphotransferase system component IIA